ncbi:hypothetical protein C4D60_Mb07t13120 [Musa balbisiana]|uniref:Uncharacterized protein n=1 Tax=Musa balbisiana TaxID=52838 RepID=A0A4S8JEX9_MUSBA|nr:hypothetical protein C4D60_Mb07t13120 [Musa balbisiana]
MRAEERRVRSVALWPSSSIICNAGVTRSDYPYLDPNSVILLLEGTVESVVLTILGYVPGIIYAIYVIVTDPERHYDDDYHAV